VGHLVHSSFVDSSVTFARTWFRRAFLAAAGLPTFFVLSCFLYGARVGYVAVLRASLQSRQCATDPRAVAEVQAAVGIYEPPQSFYFSRLLRAPKLHPISPVPLKLQTYSRSAHNILRTQYNRVIATTLRRSPTARATPPDEEIFAYAVLACFTPGAGFTVAIPAAVINTAKYVDYFNRLVLIRGMTENLAPRAALVGSAVSQAERAVESEIRWLMTRDNSVLTTFVLTLCFERLFATCEVAEAPMWYEKDGCAYLGASRRLEAFIWTSMKSDWGSAFSKSETVRRTIVSTTIKELRWLVTNEQHLVALVGHFATCLGQGEASN